MNTEQPTQFTPPEAPHPTDASQGSNRSLADRLATELLRFIGTEGYYRYPIGSLLLTAGVKHLADNAGCFWLLDAIASYQCQLAQHSDERLHEMQFWTLAVNGDRSALLTCSADSGEPPAIHQEFDWTDFPLPEVQIWLAPNEGYWVAMLPGEY